MKKLLRLIFASISVILFILNGACNSSGMMGSNNDDSSFWNSNERYPITGNDNEHTEKPVIPENGINILSGAYNDNQNYNYWLMLNNQSYFYNYNNIWNFKTTNRLEIILPKGLKASVSLYSLDGSIESKVVPDVNGVCYLFPMIKMNEYTIQVDYYKDNIPMIKTCNVRTKEIIYIDGDLIEIQNIDLMFVIDTTGSMINELNYLKQEVKNIINQVTEQNIGVNINLSFVVYRDEDSEYITKHCAFSNNIDEQLTFLNNQIATGGGDYEESVVAALETAVAQNWRDDSIKLLIHIGDATDDKNKSSKWYNVIKLIAEKGIRIISVAANGSNQEVEYVFRVESLLTNGTYIYLKDEPDDETVNYDSTFIKEPVLEKFNKCLIRLINGYYQGNFAEPEPYI